MATVRIFIERSGLGWHYAVDVRGRTVQGWRPTRRWALAVARRHGHHLGGEHGHDQDHDGDKGDGDGAGDGAGDGGGGGAGA